MTRAHSKTTGRRLSTSDESESSPDRKEHANGGKSKGTSSQENQKPPAKVKSSSLLIYSIPYLNNFPIHKLQLEFHYLLEISLLHYKEARAHSKTPGRGLSTSDESESSPERRKRVNRSRSKRRSRHENKKPHSKV